MSIKIVPRRSNERGHADHGWLKSFHTFSFASYQDGKHEGYGSLRVVNEDRVEPDTGFGTHGHREFEIFSYLVSGQLRHRDSMGNVEILKRGDLQMTSAGTGITHSEEAHGPTPVHFIQIWSVPSVKGLKPQYYTRHFTDDEKKDKWVRLVAPVGEENVLDQRDGAGPAPVHSPVSLYASLVSPGTALSHTIPSSSASNGQRKAYVHVIQTSEYNPGEASGATVEVSGSGGAEKVELKEGDGLYVMSDFGQKVEVKNVGDKVAEVLLFDIE